MGLIPYRLLPFQAKIAIQYFGCFEHGKLNIALLDQCLDNYFKKDGVECDKLTRQSCHAIAKQWHQLDGICLQGFLEFKPEISRVLVLI